MCQLIYLIYKNLVQRILANNVEKMRFTSNTLNTVKALLIAKRAYQIVRYRLVQFVGFESNACPFRRWPFLFLQQFV